MKSFLVYSFNTHAEDFKYKGWQWSKNQDKCPGSLSEFLLTSLAIYSKPAQILNFYLL
jgi:hypothetical protein